MGNQEIINRVNFTPIYEVHGVKMNDLCNYAWCDVRFDFIVGQLQPLISCKFNCYIYTFLLSGEENAHLGVGISWKVSQI